MSTTPVTPKPVPMSRRQRMTSAPTPILNVLGRLLFTVISVSLILWSFEGMKSDISKLGTGLHSAGEYIARFVPHNKADWSLDWEVLQKIRVAIAQTVQMAICGSVLGALAAFPISFIAARTGIVPRSISGAIKTVLNVLRAIPTIIYALLATSAVGLGAPAGAAAIAFVTFISLSKMYAEALESVSPGPVEAVRASGGNSLQVFVYGMLPQVFPIYLSNTLYALEFNFKDSFIVGIVGAGGLGYELLNYIRIFKLMEAGVIVGLMIVLVNCVDYLSYRMRLIFT